MNKKEERQALTTTALLILMGIIAGCYLTNLDNCQDYYDSPTESPFKD